MARGVQGGYGICVCEGIIITLPAKSFGGGGFLRLQAAKAGRIASGAWPLSHNVYYVKFIV
jgi:hypothetical protein